MTLRLSGFSFVLYPESFEFGMPDPVLLETGFLQDDDLFWVPRDYPQRLERLAERRPPLILMGDSCTALGRYDRELARLVAERRGAELAYGNVAVPGWSSYQGQRQLERDVLPLGPEVVTLYYGWNDHWIGFGIEDRDVARIKAVFESRWSRLRLVQLVTKAAVAVGARLAPHPDRVPLGDFAGNLRAMVAEARDAGVRPVLLTAPSAHRRGEEPEHLARRWLRDLSELVPLHQGYVEAVRRVAEEEGAPLCDLAARFDRLPPEELRRSFHADGIHFTPEGDRRAAEYLYDCFAERGILDAVTGAPGI